MQYKFKVVEDTIEKEKIISKNEIQNILPQEVRDYMLNLQIRLLENKIQKNPDIKDTDEIDFEELIALVEHSDLRVVNPEERIIKIKIGGVMVKDFINKYQKEIEEQINKIDLGKDKKYSIYNLNQSIHILDKEGNESKNESGYYNFLSKGEIIL